MRGRSDSAVVAAVSRAAMAEVQLEKIKNLIGKNWLPRAVCDEIERLHGSLVYSRKTIAYYRAKHLRLLAGCAGKRRGRPTRKGIDVRIRELRQAGTRVSVRKTAKLLREPPMTVLRRFRAMGGTLQPIRTNPHLLTAANKSKRINLARDLLCLLRDKKKWPRIVTGDETWIYLNNIGKTEWLLPGEEPTVGIKRQIGDKKLLLKVFFSTSGVHFAEFQPEGETITAQVMCTALDAVAQELQADEQHPAWVHMDNARPHIAKTTQNRLANLHLHAAPHPPYSPDLAPCDFYLFGHLKDAISCRVFSCYEEMRDAVFETLHKIEPKTLRGVYTKWIRRLEECVKNGGEYIRED